VQEGCDQAGTGQVEKDPVLVWFDLGWHFHIPPNYVVAYLSRSSGVWESLIYELITTYDNATGNNCKPVLLLIDEAGRTASIPNLPDHLTTVRSRGISLVVAIQSLSQLVAIWGKARQEDILNNCESHVYYRPSSHETAEDLQKWLGDTSGFAHSETDHEGTISKGSAEQRVALMTAQEIKQLEDDEIIGWHRNLPPFRAKRMNWRRFPLLRQRQAIPPPPLSALPPLEENLPEPATRKPVPLASWHMDPNLFRKWRPLHTPNGIKQRV
jgi:type IV secretory pathway TraG/TraD family ATPase VirD4